MCRVVNQKSERCSTAITHHIDVLFNVDWRLFESLLEVGVVFIWNVKKLNAAGAQVCYLYNRNTADKNRCVSIVKLSLVC